ncbi:hypothetical protein AVEN_56559-1 [Araneus ventricosus]|uniref:Tc1-like transposase DDE domain-containing protein n=1 Tax=Araneus ventricosus TaxID=182803 RepID=A0A4Y2HGV6_ARAVE|nr:hypothetical protein AVEN_56559-1 [Araneus ventricosus]
MNLHSGASRLCRVRYALPPEKHAIFMQKLTQKLTNSVTIAERRDCAEYVMYRFGKKVKIRAKGLQDCKNGNKPRGVLFLDDNARSHTERDTKEHIRRPRWERFIRPAYIPDLAPSDFQFFPAFKSALSGRHFRSNEKVQML